MVRAHRRTIVRNSKVAKRVKGKSTKRVSVRRSVKKRNPFKLP